MYYEMSLTSNNLILALGFGLRWRLLRWRGVKIFLESLRHRLDEIWRGGISNLDDLFFYISAEFEIGWKSLDLFELIWKQTARIGGSIRLSQSNKKARLMIICTDDSLTGLGKVQNFRMNGRIALSTREEAVIGFLLIGLVK